jgi:hypothetical protein
MNDGKIDFDKADEAPVVKTIGTISEQTKPDDFWKEVDKQFKEVTQAGRSAFVINKYINVILVITLIGSSIIQTWIPGKNADPWSALMGGIGIGSFVIVFFNNPQSNINKAVASLASIFIIYKAHKIEFDAIYNHWISLFANYYAPVKPEWSNGKDISDIVKLNNELEKSTKFYADLVNSHLEVFNATKSKDGGKSKKQGKSQQPVK